jgi:RNA polymerase sigma factor (sigma-70 family)
MTYYPCHKIFSGGVIIIAGVIREGWEIKPAEFEVLFKNYYPLVYRRLYYLLGERAAAEDLTQEVFLKLYRQPPQDKNNLGGWLLRTAANLAYNRLRDEERRRRREEGQFRVEAGVIFLEEAFIRSQEARQVHQCLAQLPPRDSICLLLKNAGYSYTEIAAAIQVDKNSVGTILARARRRFADLYSKLEGRNGYVSGRRPSGSFS